MLPLGDISWAMSNPSFQQSPSCPKKSLKKSDVSAPYEGLHWKAGTACSSGISHFIAVCSNDKTQDWEKTKKSWFDKKFTRPIGFWGTIL